MKKIIFISAIFVIQSCSGNVKSTWSCPTPEGGKGSCISIKDADFSGTANSLEKPNFTYLDSKQKIEIKLIAPKLDDLKKITAQPASQAGPDSSVVGHLPATLELQNKLRTQEKVGRVWFAPHIDSEGNQHSESIVYVVDETSKWVMQR